MLHNEVQFTFVMDAMDAAAVSHIVEDVHRQGTGALRHETDIAAEFGQFLTVSIENILSA